MTLPVDIQTITVTGYYADGFGVPLNGQVRFTPSSALADATGQVVIGAAPCVVDLVDGRFSVVLPCTDNATLSPTNFAYMITERVPGGRPPFLAQLPHTLGPTVDISDPRLVPVNPLPPYLTIYGVLANSQTWTGNNTFTGAVSVPDPVSALHPVNLEYFNTHGGAAVTSVNNQTGNVHLTYADVQAIAAVLFGAASGVATLDPASHLAPAQVPFGTVAAETAYGLPSANGSAATVSHADHTHGTPVFPDHGALKLGLVAQPFPMELVNHTDLGASAGFMIAMLIRPGKGTITNLGLWLGAAGTTGNGQNAMALYSEAGAQLGITGDMTAALTGSAPNTYVEAALGAPVATAESTNYYVAVLCHCVANPAIAGFLPTGGISYPGVKGHYPAVELAAQATLPGSFTPNTAILAPASYWLVAS